MNQLNVLNSKWEHTVKLGYNECGYNKKVSIDYLLHTLNLLSLVIINKFGKSWTVGYIPCFVSWSNSRLSKKRFENCQMVGKGESNICHFCFCCSGHVIVGKKRIRYGIRNRRLLSGRIRVCLIISR